jgi:CheY-like chemotaxis protein
MDDQAAIKELIRNILAEIEGAEVEFASDVLEAIELYKEARAAERPFDIVLLDLTIRGGMGGKEAIRRLLEIDPDTKAIVFSGYSDDPIISQYQEYGFKGVIRKPFDIDEFLECLLAVATLPS